jgi:hypothetical protein
MTPKSDLIDAEMLARFAELKPEDVEEFRHSVAPGFVPEPWWSFDGQRIKGWKMWQEIQALVRDTWDAGFPPDHTLSVLVNYFSTATQPESHIEPALVYRALPYQRATMFLFNQCWRARRCQRPDCRKRFVAKTPNDQFCSDECRVEFRREYKAAHIRDRRANERRRKGRAKGKR